jgi:dTDP-4-dehydrorhamnose 3,5-epimerase
MMITNLSSQSIGGKRFLFGPHLNTQTLPPTPTQFVSADSRNYRGATSMHGGVTMELNISSLELPGALIIRSKRFEDRRGRFAETYVRRDFICGGITTEFVQDNQSLSVQPGTVRGLHFQTPPYAQSKLVRVLRGRILDVIVDLRRSSSRYGEHIAVELSEEGGEQLFVPAGFAHGFCTLEPNTEVLYKVDAPYSASHDGGIYWADSALAIPWPVGEDEAVVSDKDRKLPRLTACALAFQ